MKKEQKQDTLENQLLFAKAVKNLKPTEYPDDILCPILKEKVSKEFCKTSAGGNGCKNKETCKAYNN